MTIVRFGASHLPRQCGDDPIGRHGGADPAVLRRRGGLPACRRKDRKARAGRIEEEFVRERLAGGRHRLRCADDGGSPAQMSARIRPSNLLLSEAGLA
jgi:hypothetical protein